MTRNRTSAKKAGASFERLIANHLAVRLADDRIDRRVKTGAADKGDIAGLRSLMGGRIVVECKDYGGQLKASEWLREANTETVNDDAVAGFVVAKRRGITEPGKQIVLMELDHLVTLLKGGAPDLRTVSDDPDTTIEVEP